MSEVEIKNVQPHDGKPLVSCRTFSSEDMEAAFKAGVNKGCDLTLIIEHNGNHNCIQGYPSFKDWMLSTYGG